MNRKGSTIARTFCIGVIVALAPVAATLAQSAPLPDCTGWSNCNPGRALCKFENLPAYIGRTIVADASDGLASDGRGPYVAGSDGVRYSLVVQGHAGLGFADSAGIRNPRTLRLNLNNPVPRNGGVPLGVITIVGDNQLYVAWRERVTDISPSLVSIPVGQTVQAGQLNVSFHLEGRFHVLQMGPEAYGHCHGGNDSSHVHGNGTSSATIYRAGPARWVVDAPSGSVARLFDVSHTTQHATDKGLYYLRLHFEIVDALPSAAGVLRKTAESGGGAAVVAKYRALKRDSAQAYVIDAGALSPSGFWFLDNKRPEDALQVFRLSVEEYPTASSSHEGLGESYLLLGDTTKSIVSYRRALALDPKNKAAEDALKRFGVRP